MEYSATLTWLFHILGKKSTKAKHRIFKAILPFRLPFRPASRQFIPPAQGHSLVRRALWWKTFEMYELNLYELLTYSGDVKRKSVRMRLLSCKAHNKCTVTLILLRAIPIYEGQLLTLIFKSLKPGAGVTTGTLNDTQIRACSLGGAAPVLSLVGSPVCLLITTVVN